MPRETADLAVLCVRVPGQAAPCPAGVLLAHGDTLWVRLVDTICHEDHDIREIWAALGDDLAARAMSDGPRTLLDWLDQNCSHFVQVGHRRTMIVDQHPRVVIDDLFAQHVVPEMGTLAWAEARLDLRNNSRTLCFAAATNRP